MALLSALFGDVEQEGTAGEGDSVNWHEYMTGFMAPVILVISGVAGIMVGGLVWDLMFGEVPSGKVSDSQMYGVACGAIVMVAVILITLITKSGSR